MKNKLPEIAILAVGDTVEEQRDSLILAEGVLSYYYTTPDEGWNDIYANDGGDNNNFPSPKMLRGYSVSTLLYQNHTVLTTKNTFPANDLDSAVAFIEKYKSKSHE